MRSDGRRNDELRPVRITPHVLAFAEGSAMIEMGQTRVLCAATIEERVPPWLYGKGQGWVTAEYAMLPRATGVRTPRETRGLGGRTQEIRRLIGRSLRAAVDLAALGERQTIVDCDVIQADGGTRTASITGGYVALALALDRLIRGRILSPEVLKPAVTAVSVGVVDGREVLDLCYEEDCLAEADFNVVMTARGEFIEVQGTAEGAAFSRATMDRLLDLAEKGLRELLALQRAALGKE